MNKLVVAIAILALFTWTVLFFSFRGNLVEVNTGYVARVKTSAGFTGPVKQPSIFRLPSNWFGLNPSKAVLAETSDHRVTESVPALYMPKDNLNLKFQIVGTFSVSTEEAKIQSLFDRLTPEKTDYSHIEVISFEVVYTAYAQQALRTIAMEILAEYSIQEVLENLERISVEIQNKLNVRLSETPISVRYAGLGNVVPPDLIVSAQERAKERQIEIAKANASKEIALVKADADYQVGLKQQLIELLEAETQVLVDLVISDAVSEAYIAQRSLRVLEGLAKNKDASFMIPTSSFSNPATLLGLSGRGMNALEQNTEEKEQKLQKALELIEAAKNQAAQNQTEQEEEVSSEIGSEAVSEEPAVNVTE